MLLWWAHLILVPRREIGPLLPLCSPIPASCQPGCPGADWPAKRTVSSEYPPSPSTLALTFLSLSTKAKLFQSQSDWNSKTFLGLCTTLYSSPFWQPLTHLPPPQTFQPLTPLAMHKIERQRALPHPFPQAQDSPFVSLYHFRLVEKELALGSPLFPSHPHPHCLLQLGGLMLSPA